MSFFEEDALGKDGNLLVDKEDAFNKVGHAMHDLNPTFQEFSYSQVFKKIIFEIMKF